MLKFGKVIFFVIITFKKKHKEICAQHVSSSRLWSKHTNYLTTYPTKCILHTHTLLYFLTINYQWFKCLKYIFIYIHILLSHKRFIYLIYLIETYLIHREGAGYSVITLGDHVMIQISDRGNMGDWICRNTVLRGRFICFFFFLLVGATVEITSCKWMQKALVAIAAARPQLIPYLRIL